MKGIYNLVRWLNVLLIFTTFLAYLSPFVNPEKFSWFNILGTAYPWLLLTNLLFVLFWAFMKKKYFFFSLACILLGWNHLTGFIGLSPGASGQTKHSFNVVTFNTSGFGFLGNKNKEKHLAKVKDFVNFLNNEGQIDILCLQEVNSRGAQYVLDKLGFKYMHVIKYKGTCILSMYPILKTGEVEFTTRANSCLWADIRINNKTVRVYSLHLKSNQVSTQTERILGEGNVQERETWTDIKGIFGKFRYTSKIRVQQAKKVKTHLEQSPYPVILCGDFNETPQSYVYRMLSKQLRDTFREKGFGIGSTYAGRIPALRIDYILSSPKIKILDNKILKEIHSDHYPVMTKFDL